MPRDAQLGRIKFVTTLNQVKEALGRHSAEVVGSAVVPGARRALPFELKLPLYSPPDDLAGYDNALRTRRQVRALLNNSKAVWGGLYFKFEVDRELDGWLFVGGGDVDEDTPGVGITLGEWHMQLSDTYRMASLRTHRPARRLEAYDRRLSTQARDILGTVFSTDWASYSKAAQHFLPVGAYDAIGVGQALVGTSDTRTLRDGSLLPVLFNRAHGEVVSFEQAEHDFGKGDVVVYDRRPVIVDDFEQDTAALGLWRSNLTGALPVGQVFVANGDLHWDTGGPQVYRAERRMKEFVITVRFRIGPDVDHGSVDVLGLYKRIGPNDRLVARYDYGVNVQNSLKNRKADGGADTLFNTSNLSTEAEPGEVGWLRGWFVDNRIVGEIFTQDPATGAKPYARVVTNLSVADEAKFGGTVPGWPMIGAESLADIDSSYVEYVEVVDLNPPIVSPPVGAKLQAVNLLPNPSGEVTPTVVSFSSSGVGAVPGASLVDSTSWFRAGEHSSRYTVTRDDGSSVVARTPIGAAGVRVTANNYYAFRVSAHVVSLAGGTLQDYEVGVYWYKADGTASAVDTSDTGPVVLNPPAGQEDDLYGIAQAPSDAAFAAVGAVYDANVGTVTIVVESDAYMLVDLGPNFTGPVESATLETDVPDYFDGDSDNARWVGTPHASESELYDQPMLEFDAQGGTGWEEVYGSEHPLSNADPPVLENGLCRVRPLHAEVATSASLGGGGAWAVDTPDSSGNWVERGRLLLYDSFVLNTYNRQAFLESTQVVEWTPERAVVKFVTYRSSTDKSQRAETYVTLERGWSGPRFEAYTFPKQGAQLRWSPGGASGDAHLLLKPAAVGQSTVIGSSDEISWGADAIVSSMTLEPWVAMNPVDAGRPVAVFSTVVDNYRLNTYDDTVGYPGETHKAMGIAARPGEVDLGYFSAKLDFTVHNGIYSAEDFESNSGVQVADAAAHGGQAVESALTASGLVASGGAINTSLGLVAGLYSVWARVRVVTAGATGSIIFDFTGAASATATFTSTTYVWVYLGTVLADSQADSWDFRMWRSAGTGNVRLDRFALVAHQKRLAGNGTYDGIEDHAAAHLAEAAAIPAYVER